MDSLQERSRDLIKQFQLSRNIQDKQVKQAEIYSELYSIIQDKIQIEKIDGIKQFIVETKENGVSSIRGINVVSYEIGLRSDGNEELVPKEHIYQGDKFIITADIWTRKLLLQLGIFVPSFTAKINLFQTLKKQKFALESIKCIKTKDEEGQEIKQCISLIPYITNQKDHKIQNLPQNVEILQSQAQLADLPVDGMPIIGQIGFFNNLYLNVGLFIFSDLAFASSELLSQIIFGQKSNTLPSHFSPQRFSTMNRTEY